MVLTFVAYSFPFVISAPPMCVSPNCRIDSTRSWEVVVLVAPEPFLSKHSILLRDPLLGHRFPDPLRQGRALAELS